MAFKSWIQEGKRYAPGYIEGRGQGATSIQRLQESCLFTLHSFPSRKSWATVRTVEGSPARTSHNPIGPRM